MDAAELLTTMRLRGGLSQSALARRSGIPRTSINAYERGHRIPTASTLLRLTEACGLTLVPVSRPPLDLERNAAVLEQVLDLAELLPTRRRGQLEYPALKVTTSAPG